jgi:hypothetical protein
LPLSEKVRVEIFIPNLPDPVYERILEQLGDELTYAFGGCTVQPAFGKYRSASGSIIPDKVNIPYTDAPLHPDEDRRLVERYVRDLQGAVSQALGEEEASLIAVHPVSHYE